MLLDAAVDGAVEVTMQIVKQDWEDFWKLLGNDWYHDDDDVPETVADMNPSDVFEVTGGTLAWQGDGSPRLVKGAITKEDESHDLIKVFERWKKSRTVVRLIVEVDASKKDIEKLKKAIVAVGGKILKD